MVIPLGPARGERVVQPEPVVPGHSVRGVGERGRALVGRDHEIRVLSVEDRDAFGMHHQAVHKVVGDIQQTAHERDVLLRDLLAQCLRRRGAAPQDEPALGPIRNDDRVLDLLGLHESQHLGPVILLAIGPADPAARDQSAAQVDRLHLGRIHEDLEQRIRFRHLWHVRRPDLQAEVAAIRQVCVGSDGRHDRTEEPAQDPILVQRHYRAEVGMDLLLQHLDLVGRSLANRIEPRLEQPHQVRGDVRVLRERVVAVLLGELRAHPLPVLPIGAQDLHLSPVQSRERHQPVQRIGFGVTSPHGRDGLAHTRGLRFQVQHRAAPVQHPEVVDVDLALTDEPGRDFLYGAQSQRLQDRHERREIDLPAGLVELHPREAFSHGLVADPHDEAFNAGSQFLQLEDIIANQAPLHRGLVVVGETRAVLLGQHPAPLGAYPRLQRVEQIVIPRAGQAFDGLFQLLVGHLGDVLLGTYVHGEEDAGGLCLAQREVIVHRRAVEPLHEQGLQLLAQLGVEPIAGQRDHDAHAPAVDIAAYQDADTAVLLQLQEPDDQLAELLGRGLEQFVLGEGLEQFDRLLVVVRPRDQVFGGDDLAELVVQEWGLRCRLHVRLRREETDETALPDHPALRIHLANADVVHPRAPMDGGVGVGLAEDQEVAVLDTPADLGRELVQRRGGAERGTFDVEQDAEPSAGNGGDRAPQLRVDQLVFAIAKEHEVQLEQPA